MSLSNQEWARRAHVSAVRSHQRRAAVAPHKPWWRALLAAVLFAAAAACAITAPLGTMTIALLIPLVLVAGVVAGGS